ncbi:MAG: DnaJ domain-containing protein [Dechloromonas sp.]|nr:MAG: DnaJ domain-containing protein [Dechloromonas sp.]
MSATTADANSGCIALALAFFRAPSGYPDLLHGRARLPQGITELLLAAAGNNGAEAPSTPFGVASAQGEGHGEQQKAALFFIEQVLLAHNASHYRVLGLEPGAGAEAIKEHHRLLMRLFHPDRQSVPDERTDALATRINQAYTVLRSPGARADYDFSLRQKQGVQPKQRPHSTYRTLPRSSGLTGLLPPFVLRHLAPFMLAGIAALVALGVLLVYVNQPPRGAIGSGGSGFSQAPAADSLAPVRQPDPEEPAKANMDAPVSEPTREPLRPGACAAGAGRDRSRNRAPVAGTRRACGGRTDEISRSRAGPGGRPGCPCGAGEGRAGCGQSALRSDRRPCRGRPPKVPELKPRPPRPEQLNSLLARFADLYQRGDLEGLLDLFDGSARIERGDRTQIRAEYGELFRNSEGRNLYVWDVAWSAHGEITRGEGQFQARVMRKGDRSPRVYNGTLTIEAIQRNDRPLIVGLYHKTGN